MLLQAKAALIHPLKSKQLSTSTNQETTNKAMFEWELTQQHLTKTDTVFVALAEESFS